MLPRLKICPAFPQPFADNRSLPKPTCGGKGSKVHTQINLISMRVVMVRTCPLEFVSTVFDL